jgi:hypothetical protein
VVTGTSAAMRKRIKSMFRWTYQPTVVVICEETLGIDAEVVLGSSDESALEHRKGA